MVAEIAAVRLRLYMKANKKWIMHEVLRKNCPFFSTVFIFLSFSDLPRLTHSTEMHMGRFTEGSD